MRVIWITSILLLTAHHSQALVENGCDIFSPNPFCSDSCNEISELQADFNLGGLSQASRNLIQRELSTRKCGQSSFCCAEKSSRHTRISQEEEDSISCGVRALRTTGMIAGNDPSKAKIKDVIQNKHFKQYRLLFK